MNLGLTSPDGPKLHQFGDDIRQPGEPFTDATLDTIRALLAESDPVPEPKPLGETFPFARSRRDRATPPAPVKAAQPEQTNTDPEVYSEPETVAAAPVQDFVEDEALPERSWRKIEVVEGVAGRSVRRFLMSPRLLSVMFLCGVVIWQPWFIPMLVLLVISTLLLIGALIGQDRMARILLYFLKRYVWAHPSAGRFLQRILPVRWHSVLYRPETKEVPIDGPINPSFEERLARIKS